MNVVLNVAAKKSKVQVKHVRRVSDRGSGDQPPIIDDDSTSTRCDVSHHSFTQSRSYHTETTASVRQSATLKSSERVSRNEQQQFVDNERKLYGGPEENIGRLSQSNNSDNSRLNAHADNKRTTSQSEAKHEHMEPLSFLTHCPDGTIESTDAFGVPLGLFSFLYLLI